MHTFVSNGSKRSRHARHCTSLRLLPRSTLTSLPTCFNSLGLLPASSSPAPLLPLAPPSLRLNNSRHWNGSHPSKFVPYPSIFFNLQSPLVRHGTIFWIYTMHIILLYKYRSLSSCLPPMLCPPPLLSLLFRCSSIIHPLTFSPSPFIPIHPFPHPP